jgi:2-iminoacetate synthase
VGGYYKEKMGLNTGKETPQFAIEDLRSLDEIVRGVCQSGYIPSFCTACYRSGRTGDRFMPLAKSGEIQNVCQPNAILTFKEFLNDYATPETRAAGELVIADQLEQIKRPEIASKTRDRLGLMEQGERDMYF